jgi:hypothetical protein
VEEEKEEEGGEEEGVEEVEFSITTSANRTTSITG